MLVSECLIWLLFFWKSFSSPRLPDKKQFLPPLTKRVAWLLIKFSLTNISFFQFWSYICSENPSCAKSAPSLACYQQGQGTQTRSSVCHSGGQDYRQHRAGHSVATLYVRRDRGAVVQGEVLDVLGQVHAGRGDLSGRVLCIQRWPDEWGHCCRSKAVDEERVQLWQRSQSNAHTFCCRNFRGLAGVSLNYSSL